MAKQSEGQAERIRQRRKRADQNLFARLPATYAASRMQGRRFLQAAGGLSIVEWRVLWDLCEAGPMSIRDMAEIQRTDHSLLSRALPEMRKKGLVTMRRDSADGRQMVVAVTEAGRSAYDRAAPIMQRRRAALRAHFTPEEIETFVGLLDRLEAFLRIPVDDILKEEVAE